MNEWKFLSSFTRHLIDFLSSANTKENMLMNVGNQTILATIGFYFMDKNTVTFHKISSLKWKWSSQSSLHYLVIHLIHYQSTWLTLWLSLLSTCSWCVVSALAPLSCGCRRIIQVDAAHWWWLRRDPPPHMIVKRFGCTAIHNKALYKCIIHSFKIK